MNKQKEKNIVPLTTLTIQKEIRTREERIALRREFIDLHDAMGYRIGQITEMIREGAEKEKAQGVKGIFSAMTEGLYGRLYDLTRRDLKEVRKNRTGLLYDGKLEDTRKEYITCQQALLAKAIEQGDIATASNIEDKIARARKLDIANLVVDISKNASSFAELMLTLSKNGKNGGNGKG